MILNQPNRTPRDDEFISENETIEQKILRREAMRIQYPIAYPDKWVLPEDSEIIWLLALGKCATTTVSLLLNMSEDIIAYHEVPPRLWHLGAKAYEDCSEGGWDTLIWAAKRDIVSTINSLGYVYGEMNHRLTFMAPAIERATKGRVKYLFLMRDMDSSVVSGTNWGWYSERDRNIEGRIINTDIDDVRKHTAWAWCETNEWCLDFLKDIPENRKAYLPFDAVKTRDVHKTREMFVRLGLTPPPDEEIEYVYDKQVNKGRKWDVPKNWHEYDDRAKRIMERAEEEL